MVQIADSCCRSFSSGSSIRERFAHHCVRSCACLSWLRMRSVIASKAQICMIDVIWWPSSARSVRAWSYVKSSSSSCSARSIGFHDMNCLSPRKVCFGDVARIAAASVQHIMSPLLLPCQVILDSFESMRFIDRFACVMIWLAHSASM